MERMESVDAKSALFSPLTPFSYRDTAKTVGDAISPDFSVSKRNTWLPSNPPPPHWVTLFEKFYFWKKYFFLEGVRPSLGGRRPEKSKSALQSHQGSDPRAVEAIFCCTHATTSEGHKIFWGARYGAPGAGMERGRSECSKSAFLYP